MRIRIPYIGVIGILLIFVCSSCGMHEVDADTADPNEIKQLTTKKTLIRTLQETHDLLQADAVRKPIDDPEFIKLARKIHFFTPGELYLMGKKQQQRPLNEEEQLQLESILRRAPHFQNAVLAAWQAHKINQDAINAFRLNGEKGTLEECYSDSEVKSITYAFRRVNKEAREFKRLPKSECVVLKAEYEGETIRVVFQRERRSFEPLIFSDPVIIRIDNLASLYGKNIQAPEDSIDASEPESSEASSEEPPTKPEIIPLETLDIPDADTADASEEENSEETSDYEISDNEISDNEISDNEISDNEISDKETIKEEIQEDAENKPDTVNEENASPTPKENP